MSEAQSFYHSHGKLPFLGEQGQTRLSNAKVLIIGAGGLGCPCLLTLAGCGVGTIGIADFDTVSITNLHRQTLYNFEHIGYAKTGVAKEILEKHNPYITFNEHRVMITESNILEVIEPYDLVIDGTDNFAVRYLINDACVYLNKPLVYGAIYRTEGHSTVFNYRGSGTLRCLFPEPDADSFVPSCAEIGAYNVVTAIIGNMMANEAVKVILHNEEVFVNKLAIYDAIPGTLSSIGYKLKPQSKEVSVSRFTRHELPVQISPQDYLNLQPETYYLIDVREDWEREDHHIGGEHIPLNQLNHFNLSELDKNQNLIIYCQQGQRSEVAAKLLRKLGFEKAVSLLGGLNALKSFTDQS